MFIQQTNVTYRESSVSFVEGPTIPDAAWEITSDKVLLGKILSKGFFSKMYHCTIQGPITTPYNERNQLRTTTLPAVVKILTSS